MMRGWRPSARGALNGAISTFTGRLLAFASTAKRIFCIFDSPESRGCGFRLLRFVRNLSSGLLVRPLFNNPFSCSSTFSPFALALRRLPSSLHFTASLSRSRRLTSLSCSTKLGIIDFASTFLASSLISEPGAERANEPGICRFLYFVSIIMPISLRGMDAFAENKSYFPCGDAYCNHKIIYRDMKY